MLPLKISSKLSLKFKLKSVHCSSGSSHSTRPNRLAAPGSNPIRVCRPIGFGRPRSCGRWISPAQPSPRVAGRWGPPACFRPPRWRRRLGRARHRVSFTCPANGYLAPWSFLCPLLAPPASPFPSFLLPPSSNRGGSNFSASAKNAAPPSRQLR